MNVRWWGEDVVPRIQWRIDVSKMFGCQFSKEGEEIPDGYGIAYYRSERPSAVCYPLPINLIVGFVRAAWWHLRCPPRRFEEYKLGMGVRARAAAWEDGFYVGQKAGELERVGLNTKNPYR